MKIIVCPNCTKAMVYAMKDFEGSLEEVYECGCGECSHFDSNDNIAFSQDEEIDYHGRIAIIEKVDKFQTLVHFTDIDDSKILNNSEIVSHNT